MKKLIINWILSALCLYVLSLIFSGIQFTNFAAAIIAAFVLGLVNCIVKPILHVISFPITVLTLGLFSLIINAITLSITSNLVKGFTIDSFITAFFASIVLSVLNMLFVDGKKS